MKGFILGKKGGVAQFFDENKERQVSTTVQINDCYVTQIKTPALDGYFALQVGTQTKKPSNINKVIAGQSKKSGGKNPALFF
jgi:large subunit ribosomal protein L3